MGSMCIKEVGGCFYCSFCDHKLIKYGFTKGKKQRYRCGKCNNIRLRNYKNLAYNKHISEYIVAYTKEGVGIRSTARLLKIAVNTVLSRIKKIAQSIKQPPIPLNQTYEVDELCTFVKHKENRIWVVYAFCRETGKVGSFNVGKRTNKTLSRVIQTVQNANPKKIITDKLKNYRFLIREKLHSTKYRGINHIERMNLTLRTHLKRLNRRSLAYSRSLVMLSAALKIYFWG
jgi:insertion element IS1 protein InsB